MVRPRSTTLLLVGLLACAHPRDSAEVAGEYEADYGVAKETLWLRTDGTFKQMVALKATAKRDSAFGAWKYDPVSGYVTMEDTFLVVLNGYRELNADYDHPKRGSVSEPVESLFGRITLGTSEGILYHKRSSPAPASNKAR